MIWILRFLNKLVFNGCKPGEVLADTRNFIYSRLKKCPHCKEPFVQLSRTKKGGTYRRAWVQCSGPTSCGNIYCVHCMVAPRGLGTCPNCVDDWVVFYDKYIEERRKKGYC